MPVPTTRSKSSLSIGNADMSTISSLDVLSHKERERLERLCVDNSISHFGNIATSYPESLNISESEVVIEQVSPDGICKGRLRSHGDVRVRIIRLGYSFGDERLQLFDRFVERKARSLRKILGKAKEDHPPLLNVYGLSSSAELSMLCVVSEWPSGNLMQYLEFPYTKHDKLAYVKEIAKGLEYLHLSGCGIVHGDIRGENILVRQDGTCCLGEFAFESVPGDETLRLYDRWIAPELVDLDLMHQRIVDGYRKHEYQGEFKKESDIFALACTIIEIYTGKPPGVQRIPKNILTFHELVALERPRSMLEKKEIPDDLWWTLNIMLRYCPTKRLDAVQLCQQLGDTGRPMTVFPGHSPAPISAKLHARRLARQLWH